MVTHPSTSTNRRNLFGICILAALLIPSAAVAQVSADPGVEGNAAALEMEADDPNLTSEPNTTIITRGGDDSNPFKPQLGWNASLELGGSVWGYDGPWNPFFGRIGVGMIISFFDPFITINAVGSVGMTWAGGLQVAFNSRSTGLWAQTTFEIGKDTQFIGSLGVGWTLGGIEYQQDFSDGFRGPKSLVIYIRVPFGIFFL